MKKILGLILLGIGLVSACKPKASSPSAVKAVSGVYSGPAWMRSPEVIFGTITKTWGLTVSQDEEAKYLHNLYSMLGGANVTVGKSSVTSPNALYVLAVQNISTWLSAKLMERQGSLEAAKTLYMFSGLQMSAEDTQKCFENDASDWCDFDDGLTTRALSEIPGLEPQRLSKTLKKRIMHNIQDIGEFMLLSIDNNLMIDGTNQHAPAMLLEKVFIPTLGTAPITPDKELKAWEAVVFSILMSGGFFLEAPATN